jgi:peptidoglycan/xylan/chitin deacetylase (PgdA/CDA1 family)
MKKTFLIIISLIVAGCLTAIVVRGIYWLSASKRPQIMGEAYTGINTDKMVVALTYDDGPNPPFTDSILSILKRRNIKATFFVEGQNAINNLSLLHNIVAGGHEIGNHTWHHKDLIFRSPFYIRSEIEKTDSLIRSIGYTNVIYFRAPKGRKLVTLPFILSETHRVHILFDVVPMDWEETRVQVMLKNVCGHVHPGAIILLHDGGGDRSATVKLTETLIDSLTLRGYKFVTITQLLACKKTAGGID